MACKQYDIYQGETGPVLDIRPTNLDSSTTLDANWVCYIAAMDSSGTNAVTKRQITDKTSDSMYFRTALLPAETAALTTSLKKPSVYTVAVEVTNATTTPLFNQEWQYKIRVLTEVVT